MVIVHCNENNLNFLKILDLSLNELYSIRSMPQVLYLTSDDFHIYSIHETKYGVVLRAFDQKLKYLSHDYLPSVVLSKDLQQLEVRMRKVFLLDSKYLKIYNEIYQLLSSVQVFTEKFLFDSNGNILFYNMSTGKVNCLSEYGDLLAEIRIAGECSFNPVLHLNECDLMTILDESFNSKKIYKHIQIDWCKQ